METQPQQTPQPEQITAKIVSIEEDTVRKTGGNKLRFLAVGAGVVGAAAALATGVAKKDNFDHAPSPEPYIAQFEGQTPITPYDSKATPQDLTSSPNHSAAPESVAPEAIGLTGSTPAPEIVNNYINSPNNSESGNNPEPKPEPKTDKKDKPKDQAPAGDDIHPQPNVENEPIYMPTPEPDTSEVVVPVESTPSNPQLSPEEQAQKELFEKQEVAKNSYRERFLNGELKPVAIDGVVNIRSGKGDYAVDNPFVEYDQTSDSLLLAGYTGSEGEKHLFVLALENQYLTKDLAVYSHDGESEISLVEPNGTLRINDQPNPGYADQSGAVFGNLSEKQGPFAEDPTYVLIRDGKVSFVKDLGKGGVVDEPVDPGNK